MDEEDERKPPATRRGWLSWIGLGGGRSSGGSEAGADEHGDTDITDVGEEGGAAAATAAAAVAGWWSRYEHETISMADLALTLVSTCHPRVMPVFLARVQAIQKKRKQARECVVAFSSCRPACVGLVLKGVLVGVSGDAGVPPGLARRKGSKARHACVRCCDPALRSSCETVYICRVLLSFGSVPVCFQASVRGIHRKKEQMVCR